MSLTSKGLNRERTKIYRGHYVPNVNQDVVQTPRLEPAKAPDYFSSYDINPRYKNIPLSNSIPFTQDGEAPLSQNQAYLLNKSGQGFNKI